MQVLTPPLTPPPIQPPTQPPAMWAHPTATSQNSIARLKSSLGSSPEPPFHPRPTPASTTHQSDALTAAKQPMVGGSVRCSGTNSFIRERYGIRSANSTLRPWAQSDCVFEMYYRCGGLVRLVMGIFDKLFGKKSANEPASTPTASNPEASSAETSAARASAVETRAVEANGGQPAPPAQSAQAPVATHPHGFQTIDEDTWDDWDDPERMEWCKRQLEALKRAFGDEGKLKKRTSDEELELQTTYQKRPVRFTVDYDTGWLTITTKFVNRRGWFMVQYDADKNAPVPGADDGWEDDEEEGQTVHVFAPGVYLEEFPYEAKPMIKLFSELAPPTQELIIKSLRLKRFDRIAVDAFSISGGTDESLHEVRDLEAFCRERFDTFHQIAEDFGAGETDVQPKPRVYINGRPAQAQATAKVKCAYCATHYVADDDPRCPSCGAPS